MELTATTVLLLVSVVIPILTGLLTKLNASTTVKQVVTLTLAAANTLIVSNTMADGGAVLTDSVLTDAAVSWIVAVAAYLGVYEPHDTNRKLAATTGLGGTSGRHTV